MTTITRAPGIVLGLGIGGLLDGIVLHMLLEWHHMLSSRYPPTSPRNLRLNMIGDGAFHLVCLVLVLVGIVLLARAGPRLGRRDGARLFGWILAGWGVFNLIEGLADHYILRIHHVLPGPHEGLYDLAFLAFGAVLVAIGGLIGHRRDPADELYPSTPGTRAWR